MKPLSPSPCTVGGSRTTDERTPREARASVRCALASRASAPPINTAVEGSEASLTAEAGVAVFKISFERWHADSAQRALTDHIRESFAGLKAVTARN